jgi:hypothetical protein
MAEKSTQTKTKRDGHTASIDITDAAVAKHFESLKAHCQQLTPHMKVNNADVLRYAIIVAGKGVSGGDK